MNYKLKQSLIAFLLLFVLVISGCTTAPTSDNPTDALVQNDLLETVDEPIQNNSTQGPSEQPEKAKEKSSSFDLSSIPAYSGNPYIAVNNNNPYFTDSDMTTEPFETYSAMDYLGRCGVAYANICKALMPTEERGSIGSVKPSGWHSVRYKNVDGLYLYNRCHLIGFQLAGENANEKNLITGTRYLNVDGMLPFENMVAAYVRETGNHVLYRVTPIFEGKNLLASGVLMEGWSVEDDGDGICFNVYCYNVQPDIIIDYSDGSNKAADGSAPYGSAAAAASTQKKDTSETPKNTSPKTNYIGNKNSKKLHYTWCHSVEQMKDSNKVYLTCTREEALARGYSPCGNCNP